VHWLWYVDEYCHAQAIGVDLTVRLAHQTQLLAGTLEQKCLRITANTGVWLSLALLGVLLAASLSGCSTKAPPTPSSSVPVPAAAAPGKPSGGYYQDDGPGENPPANLDAIADAVPRNEPAHRGANRPYTVFGRTYVPNVSTDPYRQQGIASWYGKKFHGQKTSIGETYDMYAMTAAHPLLPLPSYVRVTNPANARSVVVRVNDRGPFHADRIIDLSYVAAAKLDLIRRGSGMVIVERVFAGDAAPADSIVAAAAARAVPMPPAIMPNIPAASPITADAGALYLQLGAFSSTENAEVFRARMTRELDWNREPITVAQKDGLYRVRLGPYSTRDEAEAIAAKVKNSHDFYPVISKP
jgi:rare lipoprotein A